MASVTTTLYVFLVSYCAKDLTHMILSELCTILTGIVQDVENEGLLTTTWTVTLIRIMASGLYFECF
jgi:hypothetical protein